MCCQAATIDRRSMPPSGYITHTVSAPSLHGKTVRLTNKNINILKCIANINILTDITWGMDLMISSAVFSLFGTWSRNLFEGLRGLCWKGCVIPSHSVLSQSSNMFLTVCSHCQTLNKSVTGSVFILCCNKMLTDIGQILISLLSARASWL